MSNWGTLGDLSFRAVLFAFGEPVEYQHRGQPEWLKVRGLFKNQFMALEKSGFDAEVVSSVPTVELSLKALKSEPMIGDQVLVRGQSYRVFIVTKNNQGEEASLSLKKI